VKAFFSAACSPLEWYLCFGKKPCVRVIVGKILT
jgi:hypothetical protein